MTQQLAVGERTNLEVNPLTCPRIGEGGQAVVHLVRTPEGREWAAKIFRQGQRVSEEKLRVMLAHRPLDPYVGGRPSVAWPLDRLIDPDLGIGVGYLMPYVSRVRSVFNLYNPSARRQVAPRFTYRYLWRTAWNMASAVYLLHRHDVVIGDLSESNVMVTDTGLVTLVDTDSYQVKDPETGAIYRCPVGRPEFLPPDQQGADFQLLDRTEVSDRFGLGVLVFQLLMEGTHPFAGLYKAEGDPPSIATRIKEGWFPHDPEVAGPCAPLPHAPPIAMLPENVRDAFHRCFVLGHGKPSERPSAEEWLTLLRESEDGLIACEDTPTHIYPDDNDDCPWCRRREKLGGMDSFPDDGESLPELLGPPDGDAHVQDAPQSGWSAGAYNQGQAGRKPIGQQPPPVPPSARQFGKAYPPQFPTIPPANVPPPPPVRRQNVFGTHLGGKSPATPVPTPSPSRGAATCLWLVLGFLAILFLIFTMGECMSSMG